MFGIGKKKQEGRIALGNHIDGLPIPQKSDLTIKLVPEGLSILGNGQEFEINISKITFIDYRSETEMDKVIHQSAPGMFLGAAGFGVIGAMVGGRVKTKKKRNVSHFMIINYQSDELKSIVVDMTKDWYKGAQLIDYFRELKPNIQPIKVQL